VVSTSIRHTIFPLEQSSWHLLKFKDSGSASAFPVQWFCWLRSSSGYCPIVNRLFKSHGLDHFKHCHILITASITAGCAQTWTSRIWVHPVTISAQACFLPPRTRYHSHRLVALTPLGRLLLTNAIASLTLPWFFPWLFVQPSSHF